MLVEQPDIAALRLCEELGTFPTEGELAAVELTATEFRNRLRRLTDAGVIQSFKATLAVPPLLGGDWVLGSMLATADRPLGIANLLAKRLPFVTETVINYSLPAKVGPNFALLFYSRDFETEARYIRSVPGLEHSEICRVVEYSFPVSRALSTEEKALLRLIAATPTAGIADLGTASGKGPEWVRVKLDQLLWTPANGTGVLRILPELDWTKVENFGHFHFLLATGHKPEPLLRIIAERGFRLVLDGQLYRDRYLQVEADCWGIADLMERVGYLDQTTGINVKGVLLNQNISINSGWVPGLLK